MKRFAAILMKGLAAVLPISMTLYVIWWLAHTVETLMRGLILSVIPAEHYHPGMGILIGLGVLFVVGSVVNAYVVRRSLAVWEDWLGRIPLVKTIYGAMRDITRLLPSGHARQDVQSVVVWRFNHARMLGFVTREAPPEFKKGPADTDLVAVYFPLSYMLGGITLYIAKSELEPINIPVETAMRLALTGGMASTTTMDDDAPLP